MGENKYIKELDAFAKKYVKEIEQQKPSLEFTNSLMDKLVLEKKTSAFKTTELISKKGWFAILLSLIAIIFIPFKSSEESFLNLPKVDFSFFDKFQMPNLFDSISISNIGLYAVFFFGFMLIAQVIFLKKHFENRFH